MRSQGMDNKLLSPLPIANPKAKVVMAKVVKAKMVKAKDKGISRNHNVSIVERLGIEPKIVRRRHRNFVPFVNAIVAMLQLIVRLSGLKS